jgi:hypothetical protein
MRPTVVMVVKYTCRLLGHALASNTCLYLINSKNKNTYILYSTQCRKHKCRDPSTMNHTSCTLYTEKKYRHGT